MSGLYEDGALQQPLWAGMDVPPPLPDARRGSMNPCVAVYGPGPDGRRCGECAHIMVRQRAGRYFKCLLRGETAGPSTDHRIRWPACGRFVERSEHEQMRKVLLD